MVRTYGQKMGGAKYLLLSLLRTSLARLWFRLSDAARAQTLFRGLLFRELSHLEFAGAVPDATTIVTFRVPRQSLLYA